MSHEPHATTVDVPQARHSRWVRSTHWLITIAFFILAFTGFTILRAHPRLYWGEAGNDLTPALLELPISGNHQHGGWDTPRPFFVRADAPVSASRTFDIFNKNGWGRSLHFLAAWCLVVPGVAYVVAGIVGGHFRRRFFSGYGRLQGLTYTLVVFVAAPLIVLTGLAMSPAITAAFPFLLRVF